VKVFWSNRPNGAPDILLGTMPLTAIDVSGQTPKSGNVVLDNTEFTISNVNDMSEFSKFLISGSSFSWTLKGSAEAKAMGLTIRGLEMNKQVELKGNMNIFTTLSWCAQHI
jgi:hypothetical protein